MGERYAAEAPSLGDVLWVGALLVLLATAPLVVRIIEAWQRRRYF